MLLLPPAAYRRVRWKNDGGWTSEIARCDDPQGAAGAFLWRISIAEIERDGPFSVFPGIQRELLLLEGEGIELRFGDAAPRRLTRRFERLHFSGDLAIDCRLLDGPTRDFNVMVRAGRIEAQVLTRPLVGSMVLLPEPGAEWLVHVAAGTARARRAEQRIELETGASLRVDFAGAEAGRVQLDGAGELILVKLTAAAP